ncbi:MAG: hypothetical protein H0W64_05360 [Gammaproteobacteria bacterium]|nr:hypothetical protein [Gammaproteobacteria bacterium]
MKNMVKHFYLFLFLILTHSTAQALTPCHDASRQCMIAVGKTYLNALVTHDAAFVPLAEDVKRWQNGVKTAANARDLRMSIDTDFAIKTIKQIRDVRWIIDGNQAIAFYLLDTSIPYAKIHASTTRIAERFLITDGLIKEIEVIFCNSPSFRPEGREVKPHTPLSFICTRTI